MFKSALFGNPETSQSSAWMMVEISRFAVFGGWSDLLKDVFHGQ
jgi:hypothetical protein